MLVLVLAYFGLGGIAGLGGIYLLHALSEPAGYEMACCGSDALGLGFAMAATTFGLFLVVFAPGMVWQSIKGSRERRS